MTETLKTAQDRVWQIVNQIPSGQVASYGQIARLAEMPSHSRLVGRLLSRLPDGSKLPWHRVVNAAGRITNPNTDKQKQLLEKEGVTLLNGKVSLSHYGWKA